MLDIKKAIRKYVATEKDILCAYLFGSTALGKENKFSDVDIAILFDDSVKQFQYTSRRLSIMDRLSRVLDREVDVVILNEASCFLKFQVIKHGLRLYERPNRKGHDFEARALLEYFDFLPIRKRLESALINSLR